MKKENKYNLSLFIINCLCAVIWIANVILDIVHDKNTLTLILHFFCAVIFSFCAMAWFLRLWKEKSKNKTEDN